MHICTSKKKRSKHSCAHIRSSYFAGPGLSNVSAQSAGSSGSSSLATTSSSASNGDCTSARVQKWNEPFMAAIYGRPVTFIDFPSWILGNLSARLSLDPAVAYDWQSCFATANWILKHVRPIMSLGGQVKLSRCSSCSSCSSWSWLQPWSWW